MTALVCSPCMQAASAARDKPKQVHSQPCFCLSLAPQLPPLASGAATQHAGPGAPPVATTRACGHHKCGGEGSTCHCLPACNSCCHDSSPIVFRESRWRSSCPCRQVLSSSRGAVASQGTVSSHLLLDVESCHHSLKLRLWQGLKEDADCSNVLLLKPKAWPVDPVVRQHSPQALRRLAA